jgi:hypothetical protein
MAEGSVSVRGGRATGRSPQRRAVSRSGFRGLQAEFRAQRAAGVSRERAAANIRATGQNRGLLNSAGTARLTSTRSGVQRTPNIRQRAARAGVRLGRATTARGRRGQAERVTAGTIGAVRRQERNARRRRARRG